MTEFLPILYPKIEFTKVSKCDIKIDVPKFWKFVTIFIRTRLHMRNLNIELDSKHHYLPIGTSHIFIRRFAEDLGLWRWRCNHFFFPRTTKCLEISLSQIIFKQPLSTFLMHQCFYFVETMVSTIIYYHNITV